jgi:excisionase family DNA binding protein
LNQQADPKRKEVEAELSIGTTTFFKLLNSEQLEGYYVGNQLRIKRESVDRYKAANRYVPGKRRNNAPGFTKQG